jgi:urea transport system ATP-binding protein
MSNQTITDLMLRVSDLNVFYGESHILRNIDLSAPSGEMVCLIGRSYSAISGSLSKISVKIFTAT